jgi:hypothetical protein
VIATRAEVAVSGHDLFTPAECARLRDRVLEREEEWTNRGWRFATLGAASYLDVPEGRAGYDERARSVNPLLERDFADLQVRLVDFFSRLVAAPVRLDPDLAVPGFHIFDLDGSFRDPAYIVERAHFDLQWSFFLPMESNPSTLSFTIPIELPSGGGAMQLWDVGYDQMVAAGSHARRFAGTHPSKRLAYHVGRAVIHDGMILHAIGESLLTTPCGHRITVQGHLMRRPDGDWVLYW